MTKVHFSDTDYRRSHGRGPSRTARGAWAFTFDGGSEPWFAPTACTYTEAKKAARAEAQARGAEEAYVQP